NNGPAQDTYDNLSAATGEKFLGMPFVCLSCHNGLGHLELVNTSMAKRTRTDFWKNAAFFAQVTAPSLKDPNSNSREYTVTDGAADASATAEQARRGVHRRQLRPARADQDHHDLERLSALVALHRRFVVRVLRAVLRAPLSAPADGGGSARRDRQVDRRRGFV